MPSVLLVDDEKSFRLILESALAAEGYEVRTAADVRSGRAAWRLAPADLVILDRNLPDGDGVDLLKELRLERDERNLDTTFLVVTAYADVDNAVLALKHGADDYVTKPFSPRVLLARVRTALRRHTQPDSAQPVDETIRVGALSLDASRHETLLNGKKLELSATEFSVLEVLARAPGRVFTRSQIIDTVRGHDYPVTDRSVDVQILAIRKKLGSEVELIETVRGVGYRFRDEQA